MPRIVDVKTTIYEWVGPVAPMPPHFCTTASDLVADVTGTISGFRFLGWLVVEIVCDDGTVGIGNAALSPHATKTTIDRGEALRQHRLARPRRADHQEIMATGRSDLESAARHLLAADFGKVGQARGAVVAARQGTAAELIATQMVDQRQKAFGRDDLDVVAGPGGLRP